MVGSSSKSKTICDEVDLLTVLVGKWDDEHSTLMESSPIQLLITDWAAVSLSETDGKPDVKLYAKMADATHLDKMYCPPLKSVLEEFECLGKVNQPSHAKVVELSGLPLNTNQQ